MPGFHPRHNKQKRRRRFPTTMKTTNSLHGWTTPYHANHANHATRKTQGPCSEAIEGASNPQAPGPEALCSEHSLTKRAAYKTRYLRTSGILEAIDLFNKKLFHDQVRSELCKQSKAEIRDAQLNDHQRKVFAEIYPSPLLSRTDIQGCITNMWSNSFLERIGQEKSRTFSGTVHLHLKMIQTQKVTKLPWKCGSWSG